MALTWGRAVAFAVGGTALLVISGLTGFFAVSLLRPRGAAVLGFRRVEPLTKKEASGAATATQLPGENPVNSGFAIRGPSSATLAQQEQEGGHLPIPSSAFGSPGKALPLRNALGQTLMIAIQGRHLTARERKFIRVNGIGGVILYGANIRSLPQVRELTREIQQEAIAGSGISALIAVDQEGGRVNRLTRSMGMPVFGSQKKLAASKDPKRAAKAGSITGHYLRKCGINMNLAPDLDVLTDPQNRVIGDRAFGSDAATVGAFGTAYLKALQDNGTIATVKHFPGHGATHTDSHQGMPKIGLSEKTLRAQHLEPFRQAVRSGVAAIMPAHILYKALDKNRPATLSPRILRDLLRGELKYQGIVLSDSLAMGAMQQQGSTRKVMKRAILAGVDMLLLDNLCRNSDLLKPLLAEARKDSELRARLEESAHRILVIKHTFHIEQF